MPKARNDWRNRNGPNGCGYLVAGPRDIAICKGLPNSKRD